METRCLYYYTSPEAFFHRLDETAGTSAVRLRAVNLLYERPFDEIDFGLGLLREAIGRYERRHAIPAVNSKAQIPFFRNDRFKLVGPEEELYMLSLYEQPLAGGAKPGADTQPVVSPDLSGGGPGSRQESGCAALCLELDYGILAETCLFDTISLTRCEYDPEAFIASFLAELENGEYDRFGYDE